MLRVVLHTVVLRYIGLLLMNTLSFYHIVCYHEIAKFLKNKITLMVPGSERLLFKSLEFLMLNHWYIRKQMLTTFKFLSFRL